MRRDFTKASQLRRKAMRGSARGLRAGAGDVNSLVNNSRVSLNQQCNLNAPQRIVETILRELCGEHGRLVRQE